MQNPPSEFELGKIYDDSYYSYHDLKRGINRFEPLLRLTYNRHAFRPRFRRLLEIGCGKGDFLKRLSQSGTVVGLERSPLAKDAAKEMGLDVRVADAQDAGAFPEGSFDYIYLNHAFEHFTAPLQALDAIRHWLEPGGRLFIGIPNAQGLIARIFGRHWYYLAPPLHITSSSARGIVAMLERHQFSIEYICYNSDPISIPMSIWITLGGRVDRMPTVTKALIGSSAFAFLPLVRLLDLMRLGDCIEVHARKSLLPGALKREHDNANEHGGRR